MRYEILGVLALASAATAQTVLPANPPPSNNGGTTGWGLFLDLTAGCNDVTVTDLRTASTGAAFTTFDVRLFTRMGTGLGGGVGAGPGSDLAGWTSLGVVTATQGLGGTAGVSESIDIPDFVVPAGETVGICLLFVADAGPRYFGTAPGPYQTFSDANLTLTTGEARSEPFTMGGEVYSSRGLVGEVTYLGGGGPGTKFCTAVVNSTGAPASLCATGSANVAANDITFELRDLPAASTGYLLVSRETGIVMQPGGSSGDLCISSDRIGRYSTLVQTADASGMVSQGVDSSMIPMPTGPVAAQAGETWYWQFWYRDMGTAGTATSNFSDAYCVLFE